jgi:capsular exopolysaccharide synthesis family protein
VSFDSEQWNSADSFEEAIRILRSNLTVALSDIRRPIVIVTSSRPNEGKTVLCTKLALSFAGAGQRVVLVDLDFRRPTAHRRLNTHNDYGATDVLLGRRELQESIQRLELPPSRESGPKSIYFLGTGPPAANPTELLGSGRTGRLLDSLSREADLVLLDTPPVLPVADTLVVGRMASGALMVVETGNTPYAAVKKAKDLLIRNQTCLLGVVLNKFQARDADLSYGYGYGYGLSGGLRSDEGGVTWSPGDLLAWETESAGNGTGHRGLD